MTLHGDPVRLRQIFLELSGISLKFTPTGKVTGRARALEEDETRVQMCFEVRETRVGISPEEQQRLFIPFQQADGSMTRSYGSSGLGLAISKRLVEAIGGSIRVDSQPGVGSTFWLIVQLSKKDAVPGKATTQQEVPAANILKLRFAGARILLVDDEPIDQEVARFLLEEAGLTVDVADEGAQAVQANYALILMDLQMPDMNDLDAARAIRALPGRESPPVMALTVNAFDEDRQRCLEAGMSDFMANPVRPDVFYATVLRALQGSV